MLERLPSSPVSNDCCSSSLPSEQRFEAALGHHGEQARQRERGEDPLQHEAQGAGESPALSKVPDSLQARCSSTGQTGVTRATPEVLQQVCAWIAGSRETFGGFG